MAGTGVCGFAALARLARKMPSVPCFPTVGPARKGRAEARCQPAGSSLSEL